MRSLLLVSLVVGLAVPGSPACAQPPAAKTGIEQAEDPAGPAWWHVLGDPILASIVERARTDGLTVEIAAARRDQARSVARSTRAALLPSFGASAGAGAVRQSLEDPAIRPFSRFPGFERDVQRYDARITAQWEVDLFGAGPRIRAARDREEAMRAELEAARVAVAADAALAYFNLRELQARIGIAQARSASLARQRTALRLRVAAGTVARLDLDRLDGEAESAGAAVPVLQALAAGEEARLGVLVADRALAAEAGTADPPSVIANPASLVPDMLQVSIARRPDVRAAELRARAADADISVARSARWPRLTLTGLIATIATAPASLFTSAATAAQGIGGIGLNLFDFGRIDAAIAGARATHREALARYRLTALQAQAEVETAAVALVRRRQEAEYQAAAAMSFTRAETTARRTYDAGALDLTVLLDTERGALQARENAILAQTSARRALVDLLRATAGSISAAAS
ncbi:MAG TPA: TolC family protein [Sphingomonas sp.]|jgi:NodT family efflux transporter outer membrane factor (OMF) lipoprotein|uniref:TolC family protein n=1 Tax=Sphingomonas sp. TaxID=28214 RepID=UPI002ED951BD